jgi:hypothetical protein
MTTFNARRLFRTAAAVLTVSLVMPATPALSGAQQATLVRVMQTSNWAKPSTDPSGLAYLPGRKALIVVDSEVDESPHYDNANIWFWKPGGAVLKAFKTTGYSVEPTDVTIGAGILYITDDSADRIFVVKKGPDKGWGTPDDVVVEIPTRPFGSNDPAGIGFGVNSLFITDGDNTTSDHRVYRLRRGPDGVFEGTGPGSDDIVSHFDTLPLGISKPSDVVYRGASKHLFIVSAQEEIIVETTLAGAHVATYDMGHTSLITAAGIAFATGSEAPTETHVYVSDRGLDNEDNPNENDGRIFEFTL